MLKKENLIKILFKNFDDFRESCHYEPSEIIPYNVFGDFAIYIQEKLLDGKLTRDETKKAYELFNHMASSADKEVQNILVVEVFEIFSDNKETVILTRNNLNQQGLDLFEKTLRGWK